MTRSLDTRRSGVVFRSGTPVIAYAPGPSSLSPSPCGAEDIVPSSCCGVCLTMAPPASSSQVWGGGSTTSVSSSSESIPSATLRSGGDSFKFVSSFNGIVLPAGLVSTNLRPTLAFLRGDRLLFLSLSSVFLDKVLVIVLLSELDLLRFDEETDPRDNHRLFSSKSELSSSPLLPMAAAGALEACPAAASRTSWPFVVPRTALVSAVPR
mmetsp:Transcript_19093/g.35565  ORF Transcript_19093/g.35565 Transcript_19093/m.35565 type:complete len:209 (+) Transcript_19093:307-933(+)